MDQIQSEQIDQSESKLARPGLAAAAYLRMSTDLQVNSTDNQMEIIEAYAERNGFSIMKIYRDDGKSGLRLAGRSGLRRLLFDASSGAAGFVAVLVCDVSRWGRFQDPDEAAEMELRCRRGGIAVHYCAEQFQNDGSIGSSILKTVKRAMAGEYSRELSGKVWQGQATLVRQGYHQGGRPGYGLRRLLIDSAGRPKVMLARGEMKSITTDRVVLVPGPAEEVAVVRRIFTLFAEAQKSAGEIAGILNQEGIGSDTGGSWNAGVVERILANEKYIGNSVWARTSSTLRRPRRSREPREWIRCDGAITPVVSHSLFDVARKRIEALAEGASTEAMLQRLRELLKAKGKLTSGAINASANCPSSAAYIYRFGSLRAAYEKIGYRSMRDYRFVAEREAVQHLERGLRDGLSAKFEESGHRAEQIGNVILVDGTWALRVSVLHCHKSARHRELRWRLPSSGRTRADFHIAARLDPVNETVMDYYVFPLELCGFAGFVLTERNERAIDAYRVETIEDFIGMMAVSCPEEKR